jgi:hypothetical protein
MEMIVQPYVPAGSFPYPGSNFMGGLLGPRDGLELVAK